jgi:hypothetical protein
VAAALFQSLERSEQATDFQFAAQKVKVGEVTDATTIIDEI